MPIIDGHVHLWSHDMDRYPDIAWREDGESRLPPHIGTAERLVELMDQSGVAYALNVQVPWYREDNRYHLDAVSRFPGRFAFLAVMNLDQPGLGARYEQLHHELGAQGFRLHYDEITKAAEGAYDDLIETARRLDGPLQVLGSHGNMAAVRRIVERFEGLRVVIDHLCHPDPTQAPDYEAWADYFALADYERAYVKVSLQVNQSKAAWPHTDLHGFTKRTLDAFGPARCLWGSNYPLYPDEVTYDQILAIVRDGLPFLGGDDLALVLGGTAASLWQPWPR